MDLSVHNLSSLFDQLGLQSDQSAVERFIEMHRPIATDVLLADAPFWTSAQASFLRDELIKDSDWVEVVDQLNVRLHSKP
jgi:hypothetical protein